MMETKQQAHLFRAVEISLLTDERFNGIKGWWATSTNAFNFGSKLWLYERTKITEETLVLIKRECKQALSWLKALKHQTHINVQAIQNKVIIEVTINEEIKTYEL